MSLQALPQAIFFDLDGTLLDTAPDLGAALNTVLESEQLPTVSSELYTPIASHGANGLLQLGFQRALGGDFKTYYKTHHSRLRRAFLDAYQAQIATHTVLYDGVETLLNELNSRGIKTGIVTNKPKSLTQQLLPTYPVLAKLKVVVCGDTLSVSKPSPDPILHAAEQLQVDANKCWYVGDAERDIEAGRRAGMFTVLARYGYIHAEDDWISWAADAEIHHPQDLLQFLPTI